MNEVAKQDAPREVIEGRERRREAMLPAVDIFEEDNALHLIADMPGVQRDTLSIEVNDNVLSLEGELALGMPEGLTSLYAEVRAQRFSRRFTLSHEIEVEGIQANIDNGVLRLVLPKKETHRRRRIEIKTA
ncbi:Hsp20/alpha crystallin family protein [Halomonas nitroreducens]|uniref:Hsp20/alpha crystallin family protein n=1 Tax=Halomonas nitroreducens TaxID=447425 RepID=A0A3S0HR24_9GAMM|nr:Hsp20/alpha crystallin family protein [Halomonas nitroreducens]RTQ99118.1 Hsp20/alpha crystallin family protein [Halomonas nitroreducens]